MILRRLLTLAGILSMATGYYRLFHPPELIDTLQQAPELVKQASDLTLTNMGLVLGGGVMILVALTGRR
ncbi:MAG: hypothetical protein HQM00_13910 [Magnetococcales bacterium]|nr:hypothetical protein [Magnetococcales bacterium]